MPCRELRFVLSVVFYVVNENPQNRIRSKSCRNQKKTPEIRRFQVLFWSCYPDSDRGPHPYQTTVEPSSPCCIRLCGVFLSKKDKVAACLFHCFRPLISPCGSACGSRPFAIYRVLSKNSIQQRRIRLESKSQTSHILRYCRQYEMTPALVKRGFTCHTFSANSKVPDLPHTRRSHHGKYNLRRHGCPYHKFHFLLLYRRFRPRLRCCANRTGLPSGNQVYGTCPEATR